MRTGDSYDGAFLRVDPLPIDVCLLPHERWLLQPKLRAFVEYGNSFKRQYGVPTVVVLAMRYRKTGWRGMNWGLGREVKTREIDASRWGGRMIHSCVVV